MRWPGLLILMFALILVGCNSNSSNDEPPPDPIELLTESADHIRSAETFRLEVVHSGADYLFYLYLSDDPFTVSFRRALIQYVAPERLQAEVSVLLGSLPQSLDFYASDDDQWFKLAGMFWVKGGFVPGFNPRILIDEDTGFQAALAAITDLVFVTNTSLDDGTGVHHLSGKADGTAVMALLAGLIEAEGIVDIDVYIDRKTLYPARIIIRQPDTITEDQPMPTTWTVDIYDIDAEPELTPPEDS
jgi:hypothetical protein